MTRQRRTHGNLYRKLLTVVMRSLHGEIIIHHMERSELVSFKKHRKIFKLMIVERRKTYWKYLGSYKKHIRMRKIFGNRKIVIFSIHQGIWILNSIISSQNSDMLVKDCGALRYWWNLDNWGTRCRKGCSGLFWWFVSDNFSLWIWRFFNEITPTITAQMNQRLISLAPED